uniref:Probable pectate lyase F n=1 Tax=Meloidogyne incognita TaxID=6306 RepID=Q7YW99_MELIC|nr:pectate lyase [Meloidogyne incognita]
MFSSKTSFNFLLLISSFALCKADFWPKARNNITVSETIQITNRDCNFDRYIPDPSKLGNGGQNEHQGYVFEIKNGGSLSNCIIGARPGTKGSAHGVLCDGDCDINNVWFEDVGEDAINFNGDSDGCVYNVNGGGAKNGEDKVMQFDGKGTLNVNNYYVDNYVRFCRSCGDCGDQHQRHIVITNLTAVHGQAGQFVCGVNSNYQDTCTLHDIKMEKGIHPCKVFDGNSDGSEPTSNNDEEDHGDGKFCIYKKGDIKYIGSKPKPKSKKSAKN